MDSEESSDIGRHGEGAGIRAVARRARVSPATVSRVVNGNSSVDKRLAKRVRDAIRELSYLPNPQARALGSGRSRVLGLLISEITNPFFPELFQCFESLAEKHDYEVLLGSVIQSDEHAQRVTRRMIQRRVEGVAVMTFRAESDYLSELISSKVPLVTIDAAPAGHARSMLVHVDYRHGIDQAIQHLALLGHRRIGFISGPMQHLTNKLRQSAFFDSLRTISLSSEAPPLFEGDHTFEAGVAAVQYFLGLKEPPTAILSSNDLMAVGVLRALSERNLKIPEAMSVIGFDDIHLAEFSHPPLSTIRMPREDLAAAAFEGLMRLTQHSRPTAPEPIRVKTQLVIRQSTGPNRNTASAAIEPAAAAPLHLL
jgi:DNA-binding LacI/PurR family transcriptional regulator